jgi:hypothetical protein
VASNNSGSSSLDQIIGQVAGQLGVTNTDTNGQMAAVTAQLEQLRAVSQLQADAIAQNTEALINSTVAHATSGTSSTIGTVGSIASQVLGGGLGLVPLISGIVSLFGGGSSSAPLPLPMYTAPGSLGLEGDVTRSSGTTAWTASQGSQSWTPTAATAPQITVQVKAMDSRSFLDHSQDIARAVREAMLNSHALNDVVNDL